MTTAAPKATAQGSFAKTPFAHLVQFVMLRELSGTLAIWPEQEAAKAGAGQDRILFNHGVPLSMRSPEPAGTLMDGLLPQFAKTSAPYAFYEGQDLLGDAPGVLVGDIDPYTLLSHGVRRYGAAAQLNPVLAQLGNRVMRLRVGFPIARLDLDPPEVELVERIRAQALSVPELLKDYAGETLLGQRIVYLLTLVKGLESLEAGASAGPVSIRTASTSTPAGASRAPGPRASAAPSVSAGTGSKSRPKPIPQPAPPASIPPPDDTQVPSKPESLGAADGDRWDEFVSRFSELDHQTHFDLLGVAQDAKAADITTAYFALVKRWHPDRIPTALAPMRGQIKTYFERITEAHETLTTADQRVAYVKTVADGGGTRASERMMMAIVEAAMDMQKAEVLLKRRKHSEAKLWIDKAIEKNPDEAGSYALRGWLTHLLTPGEGEEVDAALESALADIQRTLKDNDRNSNAHYWGGVVLKRMGRTSDAQLRFQSATQIDPRNVEAAREVRLAHIRHSTPPKKSGGIWKKLFPGD